MTTLIDKIRAARVLRVKVQGMTFIGKRPTVAEFGLHMHNKTPDHEAARAAITGWEGVRECDLIEGGSTDHLAFDQALWDEVLPDRPDIWSRITIALSSAVVAEMDRHKESEKNLPAG